MGTANRRVAAYLPPDLDGRFREYGVRSGLKGESKVLICMIEFFLEAHDLGKDSDRIAAIERELNLMKERLRKLEF